MTTTFSGTSDDAAVANHSPALDFGVPTAPIGWRDGRLPIRAGLKKAPKLDWFFDLARLYIDDKGSVTWKELEFPRART